MYITTYMIWAKAIDFYRKKMIVTNIIYHKLIHNTSLNFYMDCKFSSNNKSGVKLDSIMGT